MIHPILSTKLFVPEIRSNFVIRKSLVDKLIHGININNKLTLVSAPAGYGKTTLVLELLNSIHLANAWISLDDSDNDFIQFLSYLIAALKKAGVTIEGNTEEAACDISMSLTNLPITMIINDISSLKEKAILILDDFHFIHNPQVIEAVKYLLEHQPPDFHLVIITREDPQLPLSRLRVHEKLTEIRMEDLCFSRDEAEDFLLRVMGLKLSDKVVEAIVSRTEGWIAGLQLAGLSLNGYDEKDIEEFIRIFSDNHRYIIDYLVEEVISHQTEEARDFLRKTSVLNRMNGGLCDAVTGKNNGKLLLQLLEKMNLFLIPLDAKREWYRYHHLFADSLRAELSKEEELLLHKKAALWLEDNGFRQEAVIHAFKSGDMQLSLRLVEGNMEQAINAAKLATFVKWLEQLPQDLIKGSEILSVRKAWALLLIGKGNETVNYINSLGEDFIEKATPHNKGLLLSLKALFALHKGLDDSIILAEEALRFLEPWDFMARSATMSTLGRAQESFGKTADAVKTHFIAYNESLKLGHTFVTTLALMNLGTNLNIMGRRKEAIALYTEYMDGMIHEFGKPLSHIGIIYVSIAELYYESNELEKAESYIGKGSELSKSIFFNWFQNSGILEARIQFALGKRESAIKALEKSLDEIPDENISELLVINTSVLTELLLRCGKIDEAKQYRNRFKGFIGYGYNMAAEKAYLPYARLLIYLGLKEEALMLLESIREKAEGMKKLRELITFYILFSKAHFMDGNYIKAYLYMDKAISLAEPQDYCRLFLDEEFIIYDIIAGRKKETGQFVKKIMECMQASVKPDKPPEQEHNKVSGLKRPVRAEDIDRLSQRETEILSLLAKGMSNSEIAKTLYISTSTAQWHISHIYAKLEVKSRTQAILKASELKII
jgi:LuxR family transcriptional regulator, maltose regulon positive regulatory protein